MAEIHILTGPMASGKTSKMLERIHRFSNVSKKNVLLILFSGDDRAGEGVSTHAYGDSSSKIPLGKYIKPIRTTKLMDIPDSVVSEYEMIGIDEAQFYPDLQDFINTHLKKEMIFHISGLSHDSDNKKFGQIMDLFNIATTLRKLPAICCHHELHLMKKACITRYLAETKDSVVKIGGLESYEPVCLKCYLKL